MPHAYPMDDYKKQQEAVARLAASVSKKSGSQVMSNVAKKMHKDDSPETSLKIDLARRVFDESMDMFRSGDMDFMGAMNDMMKAMKGIAGIKGVTEKSE